VRCVLSVKPDCIGWHFIATDLLSKMLSVRRWYVRKETFQTDPKSEAKRRGVNAQ
jgi:hypothetical protein